MAPRREDGRQRGRKILRRRAIFKKPAIASQSRVFLFLENGLSLLRLHWDQEPTPNPSQEGNGQDADGGPLPSWERPGVGRLMERRRRPAAQRKANMNTTKNRRARTEVAPETRLAAPAVPYRGRQESELERLKQRLLRQLLGRNTDPELNPPLRRAANEAAALAWLTPYPLLVFPALLEEKVQAAQNHSQRQSRIRRRSRGLIGEVL